MLSKSYISLPFIWALKQTILYSTIYIFPVCVETFSEVHQLSKNVEVLVTFIVEWWRCKYLRTTNRWVIVTSELWTEYCMNVLVKIKHHSLFPMLRWQCLAVDGQQQHAFQQLCLWIFKNLCNFIWKRNCGKGFLHCKSTLPYSDKLTNSCSLFSFVVMTYVQQLFIMCLRHIMDDGTVAEAIVCVEI